MESLVLLLLVLACSPMVMSMNEGNSSVDVDNKLKTLSSQLSGKIYLSDSGEYESGSTMKNTRFNSHFLAVANVKSADDVSKVLVFCKENSIRPTVKSGGHDYAGRSSGRNSLSINLIDMKAMTVTKNDPLHSGPTITVEPGLIWGDIYKKVYEAGYVVVGGSAQTVSPGGYTLGGGHSPLSPKLGLGVDSTLAMTVVIADGSIITLTETGGTIKSPGSSSSSPFSDAAALFRALRGGGGGTFGVVTSYTYKLHQHPPGGFVYFYLSYPMKYNDNNKGNVGAKIMTKWADMMLNELDETWSGYVITSSKPAVDYKGSISFSLLHWGDWASGIDVITSLKNLYASDRLTYLSYNVTNFYDYQKNINDATGFRTYITNRFLQEEDLRQATKLSNIISAIADMGYEGVGCTITLLGGKKGAASSYVNADKTAVSSKFRKAYGSLSCGVGWPDCEKDSEAINWYKPYGDTLYQIGDGVYFNEPDIDLKNWKVEFWGNMTSYEQLLDVKKKYDPDHLFWCYHCVGSDLVTNPPAHGPETCIASFLRPPVFPLLCLLSLFIICKCNIV